MSSKSAAAWTFRGDVKLASALNDDATPLEALAKRFVVDKRGRMKGAFPRRANAIGLRMEHGEIESEPHSHREAQLLYLVRGEFTCEASNALWLVPPQSALWIPGGVVHRIRGRAPHEGFAVFLKPGVVTKNLPRECCAVSVTPLFRELLLRLATRPANYRRGSADSRLVGVLLDELAQVKVENQRLPMPTEPRLRKLVDEVLANPERGATIDSWARRIGVGERTLNRLLVEETGLSFSRWRQQLLVILAIQKLARGASVQNTALELGYESASSFVTMFRKAQGVPPARYISTRRV